MGQIEVYEWLKRQRIMGSDKFFRYREVYDGLRHDGNIVRRASVHHDLNQLFAYGYLDMQMTGKITDWQRTFRLKKRYLNR